MRKFLTGFLLIFSATTFAQVTARNDSITFCSNNFKVPDGCTIQKNNIKCDNFGMTWRYMDETKVNSSLSDWQKLQFEENSFLGFCNMLKKFERKRITCYLLDKKVKAYKVIYTDKIGTHCIIYASGFIKKRAVTVMLTLNGEVNTNDDLPAFPRQIIKLTR
jgi:hypothetical protein